MPTVTAFTAARSKQIEDTSIVSGTIANGDLLLYQRDGTEINAGNAVGPIGPQGISGPPDDDSVSTVKIQDLAVTGDKIGNGTITIANMGLNSVGSANIVNGSIEKIHLDTDCIDSTKIEDNALRSEHYFNSSILRDHLGPDCIDSTKLANDSVNSEHYVDNSIDNAHLASNSVNADSIAANSVGISELSSTVWAALPLYAGVTNVTNRQPAQWRRVGDEVQFRGSIKVTNPTGEYEAIATIPTGYTPLEMDNYPATGTGGSPGLYFSINGASPVIFLYNFISGTDVNTVSLTGIRYSRST